jgi:hypothetical protein
MSQRIVRVVLWSVLLGSGLVGITDWVWEGTLYAGSENSRAIERDKDGKLLYEVSHIWKKHKQLWQILILTMFFSGKTLILIELKDRPRRLLYFTGLFLICVSVIWLRLVFWEEWICVTMPHKLFGVPLCYLFVPTVFFLADLGRMQNPKPLFLIVRTLVELVLMAAWCFVWPWIELFIGWVWI